MVLLGKGLGFSTDIKEGETKEEALERMLTPSNEPIHSSFYISCVALIEISFKDFSTEINLDLKNFVSLDSVYNYLQNIQISKEGKIADIKIYEGDLTEEDLKSFQIKLKKLIF